MKPLRPRTRPRGRARAERLRCVLRRRRPGRHRRQGPGGGRLLPAPVRRAAGRREARQRREPHPARVRAARPRDPARSRRPRSSTPTWWSTRTASSPPSTTRSSRTPPASRSTPPKVAGLEPRDHGGHDHGAEDHELGEEHDHGDLDPHFWQDPLRARRGRRRRREEAGRDRPRARRRVRRQRGRPALGPRVAGPVLRRGTRELRAQHRRGLARRVRLPRQVRSRHGAHRRPVPRRRTDTGRPGPAAGPDPHRRHHDGLLRAAGQSPAEPVAGRPTWGSRPPCSTRSRASATRPPTTTTSP